MANNYPINSNYQVEYSDDAINALNPGMGYGGTEASALWCEDRSINGAMYRVQNATWSKFAQTWSLVNPALPAFGTVLQTNGTTQYITSPAGTSPFTTWTAVASVDSSGNITGTFTGTLNLSQLIMPAKTDASKLGVYNVKNYGAIGNGTTDDNAAIASAIAAAPAGATIYFPPGTYRTSKPLQPSAQGQRFIGAGISATTLTYNAATDAANFNLGFILDGCTPGQSHGSQTTSARNNCEVAFLTIDAQARNLSGIYQTGSYGGGIRTGDYWNVHDCLIYDGHYFHLFCGGWYNTIERNTFDGGDAFQDTLGGGGKFHTIRRNLWTAACSYNATQNGSDHNAIDHVGGSLSQYGYESNSPTQGTIFEENIILGAQQVMFEGSYDVVVRGNQLPGGGNIYFQSDTRYGFTAFHQTKRAQIVGNALSGSTVSQATQQGNIFVLLERATSPNTGTTEQGGGILIEGNSIEAPYLGGIIFAGDNDTTSSFGGNRIVKNVVHNANVGNTNSINVTINGVVVALNVAACMIVGGWYNMLIEGNQFIDTRGTTNAPAIVVGNASTNFTPSGTLVIEANVVMGVGQFGFSSPINVRGIATSGNAPTSAWPLIRNNPGYNPFGAISTSPTIPASTTFVTNTFGGPVDVYIAGGTLTAITRKDTSGHQLNVATSAANTNLCHLEPGESIAITYSVVPSSWTWFLN